ncbi:tetratricopeptide repeat protein [Saccharopolyspora sp. NPDC000995]
MEPGDLDIEIRRELLTLPKGLADKVAVHLVAAGQLIDSEPERALEHARYARQRAPRIPSVREANGLTAYLVGEWNEALAELRAVRRMAGGPGHLAMMADCERAMGRPERAVELSRSEEATQLDQEDAVELRIVAAGARRDLGEIEASVVSLQTAELDPKRQEPWSARLFYAYADNLLAAGREREAFTWFVHAAHADDEDETDAAERLEELAEKLGGPDVVEELVTEAEAAAEIDDEDFDDEAAELDDEAAELDDDFDDLDEEIDDLDEEIDEQSEAASADSEKAAETEEVDETSEEASKSDVTDAEASNAKGDARAK